MYIPNFMYYQPKQMREKHTTRVTGDIDIVRAQKGNPSCWKENNFTGGKEKKTIIINDFSLGMFIGPLKERLISDITTLLNEGFDVRLKQQDEILKLTLDNIQILNLKQITDLCTPASSKDVKLLAAKKDIPSESLIILNASGLHNVVDIMQQGETCETVDEKHLNDIPYQYLFLSPFDITTIMASIDPNQRITISDPVEKSRPGIFSFYLEKHTGIKLADLPIRYLSKLSKDIYLTDKMEINHFEMNNYKHLRFQPMSKRKVIEIKLYDCLSAANNLESFSIDNEKIKFSEPHEPYPNIKTIYLSRLLDEGSNFKNIFPNAEIIYSSEIELEAEMLQETKINALYLSIFGGFDNSDSFVAALKSRDHYKSIILTNVSIKDNRPLTMPEEERISTNDLYINGPLYRLTELINGFNKIVELELNNEDTTFDDNIGININKDVYYQINYTGRPHLELQTLHIKNHTLTPIRLETIYSLAPNIVNLTISGKDNFSQIFYEKNSYTFESLKSLKLESNFLFDNGYPLEMMNGDLSDRMFQLMPNLEEIKLSVPINNTTYRTLSSLCRLKKISLFPPRDIYNLRLDPINILENHPHLEEFKMCGLSGDYNFKMPMDTRNRSRTFPLRTLDLEGNNRDGNLMANEKLAYIIKQSPFLNELTLKGFNNFHQFFSTHFKTSEFKMLHHIELSGQNISHSAIKVILKMAPHLKTIVLPNNLPELDLIAEHLPNHIRLNTSKPPPKIRETLDNASSAMPVASDNNQNEFTGNNESLQSQKIDFNTGHKEITFNTKKVFYSINDGFDRPVNDYRTSIFDTLKVDETDRNHPFSFVNTQEQNFKPYTAYQYGNEALKSMHDELQPSSTPSHIARHSLTLTNTFQPLPSLSRNEKLQAIDIVGYSQDEIEIVYSERDYQYYIRSKNISDHIVDINYIISFDESLRAKPHIIPEQISSYSDRLNTLLENAKEFLLALSNDMQTFTTENLEIDPNGSAYEILDALYTQKKGACRHRATVFMDRYQLFLEDLIKDFNTALENQGASGLSEQDQTKLIEFFKRNLNVRAISNDVHAFVEFNDHNGIYYKCDLGGDTATLNVDEKENPVHDIFDGQRNFTESVGQVEPTTAAKTLTLESLDKQYITWPTDTPSVIDRTPFSIAIEALSHRTENVLLTTNNAESTRAMLLAIQYTAKNIRSSTDPHYHPIYVINKPEDIVCAEQYIKRELNTNLGTLENGPGGPLFDFLSQYKDDPNAVLIINWDNFSSDELVRFNSLIDEIRVADGTPIPKSMTVVGIYNTQKPNAYTGSDFFSRNKFKIPVPFQEKQIEAHQTDFKWDVPVPSAKPSTKAITIELFNDPLSWRQRLLGEWQLIDGSLQYHEGPLISALHNGLPVHLNNAPWDDPAFQQFWNELKIHKMITSEGMTHDVAESFWENLTQSQGYDLQPLLSKASFSHTLKGPEPPRTLNPGNLMQYLDHYSIHEKDLIADKSAFAAFKDQTIHLILTRSLDLPSWVKLLIEAQKYNVTIHFTIPFGLALPDELSQHITYEAKSEKPPIDINNDWIPEPGKTALIESSNVSDTVKTLKGNHIQSTQPPIVIDVSELDEQDIFYRINGEKSEKGIAFSIIPSDIWQALYNGETVILKGAFSDSLKDALMSLCLPPYVNRYMGQEITFKGRLVLVSESPFSPAFQPIKETPKPQVPPDSLDLILNIPASIPHNAPLPIALDLGEETVNQKANAFFKKRFDTLTGILNNEPFAFIGGKTGVGKSTFMDKYLTVENGFQLYHEMQHVSAWAQDQSDEYTKVLFIDEANISDTHYTIFEGLYENPPKILIDNKLITLTNHHKVVFAGNPMSYGGERHLPKLLAMHGNACLFEPLPPEVIFRDILKPIFAAKGFSSDLSKIFSQIILDTYLYICAQSYEEIYISPRELKLMALEIASLDNPFKTGVTEDIVYHVAKQCLPDNLTFAYQSWFLEKYPNIATYHQIDNASHVEIIDDFAVTFSRKPIMDALDRMLQVRTETISTDKTSLKSTGLGGILLEGEPGTGKSDLLRKALLSKKYKIIEAPKPDEPLPDLMDRNSYYYIPASLSFSEKKRILLAAFNQGAIVMIDEINSGPMMEHLLNALLMGQHPDTKEPAKHQGFLLLATQNPISMAGRTPTSKALKRRMLFHHVPDYSQEEMLAILNIKFPNLPEEIKIRNINHYLECLAYARLHHHEPEPVFRDLINGLKQVDKAHQKAEHLSTLKFKPIPAPSMEMASFTPADSPNTVLSSASTSTTSTPSRSPVSDDSISETSTHTNDSDQSRPKPVRMGGDPNNKNHLPKSAHPKYDDKNKTRKSTPNK